MVSIIKNNSRLKKDIPEVLSLVFEEELQLKILIPDSSQTITI